MKVRRVNVFRTGFTVPMSVTPTTTNCVSLFLANRLRCGGSGALPPAFYASPEVYLAR